MILQDGTGSGSQLKINTNNQAETFSEIKTEIAVISLNDGQAFIVSTGFINYTTTGSFSGLLYIKNTDASGRNMFIEHIRLCGTNGSGGMNMEAIECAVYRNPTAGTLISGASAAYTANSNFGSSNAFNGLAYKGADATTVTDGDWYTQFVAHAPGHSIQDYNDSVVIPKNSAMAFVVKPTVSGQICMEVNLHFK